MRSSSQQSANVIAAVLSLVIPGAGQIYKGRISLGIGWLFCTLAAYLTLLLPGVLLHFICVVQAAAIEERDRGAETLGAAR